MSRKAAITESDYSNIAVANLFKSLSTVDIFLQILPEFRNNFLKKYLRKVAPCSFPSDEN